MDDSWLMRVVPPSCDYLLDHSEQGLGLKWLHERTCRPRYAASGLLGISRFGGKDQDGCELVRGMLTNILDEGQPIHDRHVNVGDDEFNGRSFESSEPLLTIRALEDLEASLAKRVRDKLPNGQRIIDDERGLGHG